MITSTSISIDHTRKLVNITNVEDGKRKTSVVSYDGTKFNPAEFSNFSYDMGDGVIIRVK